jgi:hypothetical protein
MYTIHSDHYAHPSSVLPNIRLYSTLRSSMQRWNADIHPITGDVYFFGFLAVWVFCGGSIVRSTSIELVLLPPILNLFQKTRQTHLTVFWDGLIRWGSSIYIYELVDIKWSYTTIINLSNMYIEKGCSRTYNLFQNRPYASDALNCFLG